jgi:hypothetical protein
MKKLITLLLLFTITLFYSIPTQAYTINDLDVDILELNNNTLREVFETANLLSNNLTNWSPKVSDFAYSDNVYSFSNTFSGIYRANRQNIATTSSNVIYFAINDRRGGLGVHIGLTSGSMAVRIINVDNNDYGFYSSIHNMSIYSFINYDFYNNNATTGTFLYYDPVVINLTSLGIASITKQRLDFYFREYINIKNFIEGYNDGFDDGYDEGFDDGVASDTSYAVGYALGLSEGEDMETGSSLLILIVALIGFVMMIFGFTTKRGIFNLLSVGAFVVLGTLLVEFVGFVIIAIGLVLINIYYAFFGEL